MLSIHASLHVTVPRALGANAKMEKIKRPTKGQAETCKYEMKCTNAECDQINDFTEEIIRNVIARGIADQEIQLDLLGEKNQDMILKDMI